MTAVFAIARATLLELRRQRLIFVPVLGIILSLLLLAGALLITDDEMIDGDSASLAALAAGTTTMFGATLYALIVGSSLIAREISSGTLLMLAARPIPRWQIITGRVLGAATLVLAATIGACAVYGITAAALSGSLAPLGEPFTSLVVGVPAILLAIAFGAACSVQGRSVAAIGTAMAVAVFSLAVASYASEWKAEEQLRSYLDPKLEEQLPPNDPLIGPAAVFVVRALPFGVFSAQALELYESDFDESFGPDNENRIDTHAPGGYAAIAFVPAQSTAATTDPAAQTEPQKLPAKPTQEALDCAEYSGANCLLGYRDAWTKRYLPLPPQLDDGRSVLLAWLAIPLWFAIGAMQLTRRRDLT